MEGKPLLLERAGRNLLALFKRGFQHDTVQNFFSAYDSANSKAGLVLTAENK